jgi:hypothetical protein
VLRKFNDRTEGYPVFRLVFGDFDFNIALPFEAHIEERLYRIISAAETGEATELAHQELARRIVDVITAILEGEVLPPTDKQVRYAVAIAQELSLELPAEVLKYRESMAVFLGTHAENYRKSKGYRRNAGLPE